MNTLVFDSTPHKNVVVLGFVVDEFGQKMSKSKGNVIDPWQIFDTFGADALRWYFFSAGSPWTNRRVYEDGIREATRKTLITLWNVFAFFATYADLEGWTPEAGDDAQPGPSPSTSSTAGWRLGWPGPWRRSPPPSTASTPWAGRTRWPPSSTTCPTGTSAGHGPASGDPRLPRPLEPAPTPCCTGPWP